MTIKIELDDGKYIVVLEQNGGMKARKYGEDWRDLTGDNLVWFLVHEVAELRALVEQARNEYLEQYADGETDCPTPYDRYNY